MPITPFEYGAREIATGRGGNADAYSLGGSTRQFFIRFPGNGLDYDDSDALYHPDVPSLRSAHPTRPGLWLQNKDAKQVGDKNGNEWEVTCTYSALAGAEYPWQEATSYTWGQQSTEQIVEFDISTGKPIRNSAGCAFDPGVTATRYEAVLTVSRNELNFNFNRPLYYVGSVNSSTFYGAPRGYCMCVGMPAQSQIFVNEQTRQRIPYWSVQYVFAFRNQFSWQPKVLDAGYMQKGSTGKLIPITIAGREPSAPVPLNGKGKPLEKPDTDEPKWLDFKVYPEQNFYALGV